MSLQHGVPIDHAARQIQKSDFTTFNYVLASDKSNLANLERVKPRDSIAVVRLFGSWDDGKEIRDPYYGGLVRPLQHAGVPKFLTTCLQNGFEECYQQCVRYSNALLDEIEGKTQQTKSSM